MPEYVRPASEDEMVLEFIKAESASSDWVDSYSFPDGYSYEELIANANLKDSYQNQVRCSMLNYRGYATRTALFAGFPQDVEWSIQIFSVAEIAGFRYANAPPWSQLAGTGRLVSDGIGVIGADPNRVTGLGIHVEKLEAIRDTLRSGVVLARLIVAAIGAGYVIVEGQARATALAGLPTECRAEALVGKADDFRAWRRR